ncbi:transcriptional regulator / sugar kinase NagC [Ligilactobacillus salitolerans]|uniref:Transcriptional regulator / sugar kinase NagC n=1 Tax=Ligilactobacillus salitolerans TaxID=1808352 RepID=A0A401IR76_9LACO|nr:ROK family protein [Ligilactobacillus salitolerans]GBG94040.1 transcriptional regulator / sugar kinase NagC [Ligilactobacillus salitolerans]
MMGEDKKNFLAIDIGGTFIKTALVDEQGLVTDRQEIENKFADKESFLEGLTQIIEQNVHQISGVGLSIPGVVDVKRQVIVSSARLAYLENVEFLDELAGKYQVPFVIENDGNCAALAEKRCGNLKGVANGAMIVLGTGLGAAVFVQDQLVHGAHFVAGEPSFMVLDDSATGRAKTAADLSVTEMVKQISLHLQLPEPYTGQAVFKQIQEGEPFAVGEFNHFCRHVATIIYNIQTILDLEQVVIGGGISRQPLLIEKINESLLEYFESDPLAHRTMTMPLVVAARLYNDANLVGAVVPLI